MQTSDGSPFVEGDRVRITREHRHGGPNGLPHAVIVTKREAFAIIRYDDDPPTDPGYPEPYKNLEKI